MPLAFKTLLSVLIRFGWIFAVGIILVSCGSDEDNTETEKDSTFTLSQDELTKTLDISTDDLPAMLERRMIRVLVSYNQTNYFSVGGEKKGLEYELMKKFETYVNKSVHKGKLDVHVVFLAVPFSQLIQSLVDGKGDIAAAGLTIIPERQQKVAFSRPYIKDISEIVVSAKGAADINDIKSLSGKSVIVTRGSSYVEHLQQFNEMLEEEDKEPVKIKIADQHLVTEDLLQMVNAGIYPYTVADSHIAHLWSSTLPNIKLQKKATLNEGGKIAWAVRKKNPKLLDVLNQFARKHQQGTLMGNILIKRYYQKKKWVVNPLTDKRQEQLAKYYDLFKKYAEKYKFDWQLLAALAFQESKLKQSARSSAGAVGIMQIKPSTAADKNVAIKDIRQDVENNIHAGTKYLAFLRDRYFDDDELSPLNKFAFTAAAYNAGPAKIRRLRKQAEDAELNPNEWFDHVEHIARKVIGRETVHYVSNIYKYYVSYKSIEKTLGSREKAIDESR